MSGQPLLFAAAAPWSGLRQRHQAIAEGLAAAGWDVVYLDPLRSGGWFFEKQDLGPRLRRFSLGVPFRAAQIPSLQMITARLAMMHLSAAGIRRPETLFWTSDPSLSHLSNYTWKYIIYDRCDRHGSFPGQRSVSWLKHERTLYHNADLVLASSALLADEAIREQAKKVCLVPNAVDRSWLSPAPPGREPGPPWRLVSSGAHYEWIDHEWLAGFANLPDVELHIAGPGRGPGWAALVADGRIRRHGVLDHAGLRKLIDRCHIGLIPFRDDRMTAGVDPVKAYEYAARGLAVWAPRMASLQRHPLVTRTLSPTEAAGFLAADASGVPYDRSPATWADRLGLIHGLLKEIRGL